MDSTEGEGHQSLEKSSGRESEDSGGGEEEAERPDKEVSREGRRERV